MIEVPQMVTQAMVMKLEHEREVKVEDMRNQPIEQIIEEQNVLVPVERWSNSSIMLPTQYLAAMVYYFVFVVADPKWNLINKGVASLFKLVSGKKYHGGSHGDRRKIKSIE